MSKTTVAITVAILGVSSLRARAEPTRPTRRAAATESSASAGSEGAATTAQYQEIVAEAFREFQLGNYAEARSGFLKAYALSPSARTQRALGMVEYELKNYPGSITYLERALVSQDRPLTPDQRADTENLLERAKSYVGHYTIRVRPDSAQLLIDGEPPVYEGHGRVALSVGDHLLEAQASGHHPLRRKLRVASGVDQSLQLVLIPIAKRVESPQRENAGPDSSARVEESDTPLRKKWWLWTTLSAVVVAGAVTGVVLGTRDPGTSPPSGGTTNMTLTLPPAGK